MKRINRFMVVVLAVLLLVPLAEAKFRAFPIAALTGGGPAALDSIDGDRLVEGNGAIGTIDGYTYFYYLNATSGAAESSPDIIKPDANAGDKRWELQQVVAAGFDARESDIDNVGDVGLDSISSDDGTDIEIVLGSDPGDDLNVDGGGLLYEGDTRKTTTENLVATTADINAGTVDNTVIGGETPLAASVTDLVVTQSADMGGFRVQNVLDPTAEQDAATKGYVDIAVQGTSFNFYNTDTASGIGGIYYVMQSLPSAEGESTLSTAGLGIGDDQALVNFATISTEPNFTDLSAGVYDLHIHAEKTAGTRTVDSLYAILYKRASGGSETLLSTSHDSAALTSKVEVDLHFVLPTDNVLLSTDRLVVKLFADVSGGGTNATVAIYQEGTDASRLTLKTTSGASDLRYLVKSGLSGGQVVVGGSDASDDLTLQSTSDATKGQVIVDDDLQVNDAIELGHATDTTIARSGAGEITVEGKEVYIAGAFTPTRTVYSDGSGNLVVGDGGGDIEITGGDLELKPIITSAYFAPGTPDGTQCGAAASVQINSGPWQFTIICADSDTSEIWYNMVMPDSWDVTVDVTLELTYIQTAADTSALHSDVGIQCRSAGETIDATITAEVAIDDTNVSGSNKVDQTTSAAIDVNSGAGSNDCSPGDILYVRWQMDATGTTTAVATLNILGLKMEYTSNVGD